MIKVYCEVNKLMDKKNFYITSAIAYASKKPHIGNTYEIILTDTIARFKKLQNFNVCFCTGTDEHGQKIEQIAKNLNIEPQNHVDFISNQIKGIWTLLNCDFDIFIRTTDKKHIRVVKQIFNTLLKNDDIYKSTYKGLYCIACESFYTENQLVQNKCPDCGREVKKTIEEAYFFRAEKYEKKLLDFLKNNENFIVPKFYVNEIINNFIKPGLKDFCVSRASIKWGIEIDSDPEFVVYVWLDALINYLTAIGFDLEKNENQKFKTFWPVSLQVIGKDILRFHAIIWPMLLMALKLPMPKQILTHQWLLCKNSKMSKTTGNVIYADDLAKLFSADSVRFYLLGAMSINHDGSISYEDMIDVFNMDLANTLGNLVKRTCDMAYKYFEGEIQTPKNKNEIDNELKSKCENTFSQFLNLMENYKINEAISVIMNLTRTCNKFIDKTAPWTLAKKIEYRNKLNCILFNLIEAIRFIATMLIPIMPSYSKKILNQIGIKIENEFTFNDFNKFGENFNNKKIKKADILFNRIDKDKKLKEIKLFISSN